MIFDSIPSIPGVKEHPLFSLESFTKNPSLFFNRAFFFLLAVGTVMSLFPDSCHAISVDALRAPLQQFKAETFSWLFGVKVVSVAVGAAMSVAKMSLTPFGIGAGAFACIHLMEQYIGDGASALI